MTIYTVCRKHAKNGLSFVVVFRVRFA